MTTGTKGNTENSEIIAFTVSSLGESRIVTVNLEARGHGKYSNGSQVGPLGKEKEQSVSANAEENVHALQEVCQQCNASKPNQNTAGGVPRCTADQQSACGHWRQLRTVLHRTAQFRSKGSARGKSSLGPKWPAVKNGSQLGG